MPIKIMSDLPSREILERENVRLQPHGDLAVRTIGYLNG